MRDDAGYWRDRQRTLPPLRAVGFRTRSAGFNRWMYRARERTVRSLLDGIRPRPGPGERIRALDAGAGAGFGAEVWKRHPEPVDLVGIDVSPDAVERLRRAHPEFRFHVGDVAGEGELPVDGAFDVVTCFDVLYHITDDLRFGRAVARLGARVRPGGCLLVTDNFPAESVTTRPHVRLRPEAAYLRHLEGFAAARRVPQFLLLNVPSGIVDPRLRWTLVLLWEALTWPGRFEGIGWGLGAVLYGLDRLLLPLVGVRTPSTKLVAFRRPEAAGEGAAPREEDRAAAGAGAPAGRRSGGFGG